MLATALTCFLTSALSACPPVVIPTKQGGGQQKPSVGNLYFTSLFNPDHSFGFIERVRTDGAQRRTLASPGAGLRGMILDRRRRSLIFSDVYGDTIQAFDLRTQTTTTLVSEGLSFVGTIELSRSTSRMFWVDSLQNRIESANLDGTDRQLVLSLEAAALALDDGNAELYAGRTEVLPTGFRRSIVRASFEGSNLETVITDIPPPSKMVVDPEQQLIFWTSASGIGSGDGGVYRVGFDGQGFEEIFVMGSNLDTGAIELDTRRGHIYFSQAVSGNRDSILRMSYDGEDVVTIATGYGAIGEIIHTELPLVRPHEVLLDRVFSF